MSHDVDYLNAQLHSAYRERNYRYFQEAIEEIRALAKSGNTQAQASFIHWYRKLNPAFDRIIGKDLANTPEIWVLKFKANWLSSAPQRCRQH